jgi:lysophospholipase L1-like esterase
MDQFNLNHSRRSFIKGMALTGAAVTCIPVMESFALPTNSGRKIKAGKGFVFLFQGDSITDGNRGRTKDPNHIMGHGYAFSIASRLGADLPEKQFTFYNRGISGNRVSDLAARWQGDTLDLKPDVLSILVGVNDTGSVVYQREPVVTIEKYEEGYKALLDQTIAKNPDIILVLCEPFILSVGRVKEKWELYHPDLVKRQSVVRKLASRYNTVFVGFQEVFDSACKKAPADYWIWDGVHPTVAGHELMAREWLKQVGKRISF